MKRELAMIFKGFLCAGLVAMTAAVTAGVANPYNGIKYSTSTTIVPGEWNRNYSAAKKYADANNIPLLVFWGNDGCAWCKKLEEAMASSTFKKWAAEKQTAMVFCINQGTGDDKESAKAKEALKKWNGSISEYPYVGVYWKSGLNGVSKSTVAWVGRTGKMKKTGPSLVKELTNTLDYYLAKWTPYKGGQFTLTASEGHRYEIEAGTTTLKMDLMRAEMAKNYAATDTVSIITSDGAPEYATTVTWEEGEVAKELSLLIGEGGVTNLPALKAGESFTVKLNDEANPTLKTKTEVVFVEKKNAADNPYWIGEREDLDFGEWTMDLEQAKSLAASEGGLVLVSIQGSLWCPDCANTERNFLGLEEGGENRFQAWAREKKLALVSVDIPNFTGTNVTDFTSPALLSRTAAESTLARNKPTENPAISGADEALTQPQLRSGLGYQSRKGISAAEAQETLKEFQKLVNTNTKDGGFHRPEDGNPYRTGVPLFVLLRSDGSVAARFTRFASVSPMKADQANFESYLKRFEEMIEIANAAEGTVDATEIENNDPRTTPLTLSVRDGSAEGRLSNADFQDVFRLEGMTGAGSVELKVSSETSDAKVSVEFYQVRGGELTKVGDSQLVTLSSAGATVSGAFATAGDSFVLVKGQDIKDDSFKAESEEASHFQDFALTAKLTKLLPQEGAATIVTEAGDKYEMEVVASQIYRLTGAKVESGLEQKEGDYYVATSTGAALLEATGDTLVYQKWVPGKIGFLTANKTIKETVKSTVVKFGRSGGTSGSVKVRISVNPVETTYFYYDKKDTARFTVNNAGWCPDNPILNHEFVYADGMKAEDQVYTIELDQTAALLKKYYGNGKVVLSAEILEGDITCDRLTYVLGVTDTSTPKAGAVKFVSAQPYFAKAYTVYALENETVDLTLARVDAWVGDVATKFSKPKGSTLTITGTVGFEDGCQWWDNLDDENKIVTVGNLPKGGTSVKLTLAPVSPLKAKSSSTKAVTIVSVATNAPMFAQQQAAFDVVRYTALADVSCALDSAYAPVVEGERLTLTKLSGSIPSGLSAKYDAEAKALVFTGATTSKAGTYTAYYRLNAVRSKKLTVSGLPIKVSFHVVDFAALGGDTETYGSISNAAVTTTRTLTTLAVFGSDGAENRLAGTLTLTLPRTGKASAKYVCSAGTVTFSAKSWDAKPATAADGTLSVTMKGNKAGYGLVVRAFADGTVVVEVTDPQYPGSTLEASSLGQVWNSKHPASAWRGLYTMTLVPGGTEVMSGGGVTKTLPGGIREANETFSALAPRGSGYLVLKMTGKDSKSAGSVGNYNSGTMVWSGKLANGTSVSGSAVLSEGVDEFLGEDDMAYLPIFKKTSADRLAVLVGIACGACDAGEPTPESCRVVEPALGVLGEWSHVATPAAAQASYSMDIHAFGSYYSPSVALTNYCAISYVSTDALDFVIDTEALGEVGYSSTYGTGVPSAIDELQIKVVSAKKAVDDKLKITSLLNPQKVTVSVNRATGVVSGTFDLTYELNGMKKKAATWRGVLLPGWGKECSCGEAGAGVYLPFVNGGFTFADSVPYETTSKGKTVQKTLSVNRGGIATIGRPE